LDQSINFLYEFKTYLPWVSFIAGVGGSLHCVGMCGGLTTASCEKSSDVFRYQLGRLVGYLMLGTLAGWLGSFLDFRSFPFYFSLVPAFLIGFLFIYWGIQNYHGKKAELPAPRFLRTIYTHLWFKLVHKNQTFSRSFIVGFISILLPCGLLYGVVLGTVALENISMALVSMFFFWLGTVPSMIAAPGIIQKVLRPLKSKLPKTYALTLILIGVMTISSRIIKLHSHQTIADDQVTKEKNHCH
jgi:uncharacterized protein